MPRILVTGGGGMLARALRTRFGTEATTLSRAELDITNSDDVGRAVSGFDVVINAAAYTAVDDAETHEDDAFTVNGFGAGVVAAACRSAKVRLIHVSTDYVFGGSGTEPHGELDPTNPLSVYGRSKLAGERAVLDLYPEGATIVRTAWLYGAGGRNFVSTMLAKARASEPVSVVDDQFGQPTWTHDLAERIDFLISAPAGVYHGTNSGRCSWWEFAEAIYESVGADRELVSRTTSAAFARPAPRPSNSVLGDAAARAAGIPPMRPWRDALAEALRTDFAE